MGGERHNIIMGTFKAVLIVISAVMIELGGGENLYWKPNSNWGNPDNWAKGRVPSCGDSASFKTVSLCTSFSSWVYFCCSFHEYFYTRFLLIQLFTLILTPPWVALSCLKMASLCWGLLLLSSSLQVLNVQVRLLVILVVRVGICIYFLYDAVAGDAQPMAATVVSMLWFGSRPSALKSNHNCHTLLNILMCTEWVCGRSYRLLGVLW